MCNTRGDGSSSDIDGRPSRGVSRVVICEGTVLSSGSDKTVISST